MCFFCVCANLEFFLVQECVVFLQVQVLLLLVAQLPLCRGEQTLSPLQVLFYLFAFFYLLTQHQVLGLKGHERDKVKMGVMNYQAYI